MVETKPELESSLTCYRQVEPSEGLEKFLAAANTIGRRLFGQREKFYVKLPDTLFDLGLEEKLEVKDLQSDDVEAHERTTTMESTSVDVATIFRSRSLRATLFYLHGPASYEIDNAFLRLYARIRAETIRGSSSKRTKETRPNTLKQDIRAIQEYYYTPEVTELEVIIQGIKSVRPESLQGTLYGLSVDPESIGAEILLGQQNIILTTLAKMVAYRNAAKLSAREEQPNPLIIPFAYVPYKTNGEGKIYTDEVSNLALSHVPTLKLAVPKWKPKPESG